MLFVNKKSGLTLLRMLRTFLNGCKNLSINNAYWSWGFSKSLELRYCVERNNVLRSMRQLAKQNVKLEPWTSAMEEASRRICHPEISRARWNLDFPWIQTFDVSVLVWNTLTVSYALAISTFTDVFKLELHAGLVGWFIGSLTFFVFVFTCYLIHLLFYCWANSCGVFKTLALVFQTILIARFQIPISWFVFVLIVLIVHGQPLMSSNIPLISLLSQAHVSKTLPPRFPCCMQLCCSYHSSIDVPCMMLLKIMDNI